MNALIKSALETNNTGRAILLGDFNLDERRKYFLEIIIYGLKDKDFKIWNHNNNYFFNVKSYNEINEFKTKKKNKNKEKFYNSILLPS